MNAAFHAASSQQMGSQATFRSNSALIAAAFVPVPPVPPGQTIPHLIRSTILQFGKQIHEGKDKGRIVEVVLRPWFDLTEAILKDPKAAYEVPPEMWEEIVAGRYKEEG